MNYCPVKNRTLHKIQSSGIGNINILDLDISEITDQYVQYIEIMDALKMDSLHSDHLIIYQK